MRCPHRKETMKTQASSDCDTQYESLVANAYVSSNDLHLPLFLIVINTT
jgi:hypothetical protein